MPYNVDVEVNDAADAAPAHAGRARVTISDEEHEELRGAAGRGGHGGGPPDEILRRLWRGNRPRGRFFTVQLPSSAAAERLLGGNAVRYDFYGEFDTTLEPDAWKEYLYDPLKMLVAERIRLPAEGHLGIRILKLEEETNPAKQLYTPTDRARIEDRGISSMILLADAYESGDALEELRGRYGKEKVDELRPRVREFLGNQNAGDHVTGNHTAELRGHALRTAKANLHVSTMVLNHEVALNPRIGVT